MDELRRKFKWQAFEAYVEFRCLEKLENSLKVAANFFTYRNSWNFEPVCTSESVARELANYKYMRTYSLLTRLLSFIVSADAFQRRSVVVTYVRQLLPV